ncbi:unnamed protein product [Leptidea sinapis]|uniref:Uncharacterized protein n=1 Tax=Leptidea sinapis TaxID=189913 RepID=A0A5E4QSV8_9NEOP|nr:unnamed protein product [Leptidea sinapis]
MDVPVERAWTMKRDSLITKVIWMLCWTPSKMVQTSADRFGLYEVDYNSPERTRTPRKSAYLYKEILRTRTLDMHYEPDMSVPMTIDDGH